MYSSSSSDDEELLDSCASEWFLLLQESSLREYQVHPANVGRNNFGEYHHLYKKLRNYPSRFFEYLRMEIETFDYILSVTSEKMQKKRKNCHGNPIV
jgi:hypothetical protein